MFHLPVCPNFPFILGHAWQCCATLLLVGAGWMGAWAAAPIGLLPDNPRYFSFRGQPTVIITSGEHYGALVNRRFDFARYLDTLAEDGLNGTRLFLAYREQPGAFNIARNTLAPEQADLVMPWARSDQSGYFDGGNRFDLSRWDETYFKRLHRLMKHASERGIVVEANLFSCFYSPKSWETHPFHHRNNINGVGDCAWDAALSLRDPKLVAVMDTYVRKLAAELRRYDHVTFEICNEPYIGGVDMKWHDHIVDVLAEALRPGPGEPAANLNPSHPTTHLISWNVANGTARVTNPHPALGLFNFHYATPPDAVKQNRHLNRPIGDNETGFRGTDDAPYRMEAWDFLFAGGALYNNLDYSFVAGHEHGDFAFPKTQPGGGTRALRAQLGFLAEVMRTFNLARTTPDTSFIRGGIPPGMSAEALVEGDRLRAIYLRPAPPLPQFAMRWTGQLVAPESGEYTVRTVSDDGVRLWLDNRLLINNWNDHQETEDTARIRLEAGKPVALKLEYYEVGGGGMIRLRWTRPDGRTEMVPATHLRDAQNLPGLSAEYYSGNAFHPQAVIFKRTDPGVNLAWEGEGLSRILPASRIKSLDLELPAGRYLAEWYDPAGPKSLEREEFSHESGVKTLPVRQAGDEVVVRLERR